MFLRFGGRFGVVDLSGFKTEILRFRRNPMFQEKSYVSGAKEDKSSNGGQE